MHCIVGMVSQAFLGFLGVECVWFGLWVVFCFCYLVEGCQLLVGLYAGGFVLFCGLLMHCVSLVLAVSWIFACGIVGG